MSERHRKIAWVTATVILTHYGYDVARDGSVLYVAGDEPTRASPIVFVSDITAELRLVADAR